MAETHATDRSLRGTEAHVCICLQAGFGGGGCCAPARAQRARGARPLPGELALALGYGALRESLEPGASITPSMAVFASVWVLAVAGAWLQVCLASLITCTPLRIGVDGLG